MNNKKLSGVVYMHRISDNRMGGAARRNFNMFQRLCGSDAFKNVVIATSRWDEVDPAIGNAREEELKSNAQFFKPVVDAGAKMMRLERTRKSAQAIIRAFLQNVPTPLLIQSELEDENKDISETAAGLELHREVTEKMEQSTKQLQGLFDELNTKGKLEGDELRELEGEHQRLLDQIRQFRQEAEKLSGNRLLGILRGRRADLAGPDNEFLEAQYPRDGTKSYSPNIWHLPELIADRFSLSAICHPLLTVLTAITRFFLRKSVD
jgi:hypothetical protein